MDDDVLGGGRDPLHHDFEWCEAPASLVWAWSWLAWRLVTLLPLDMTRPLWGWAGLYAYSEGWSEFRRTRAELRRLRYVD